MTTDCRENQSWPGAAERTLQELVDCDGGGPARTAVYSQAMSCSMQRDCGDHARQSRTELHTRNDNNTLDNSSTITQHRNTSVHWTYENTHTHNNFKHHMQALQQSLNTNNIIKTKQ